MTRFATIKNLTEQRVNATPAAPACARLKPPLPVTSPHGTSGKTANGKLQIDYDSAMDHDSLCNSQAEHRPHTEPAETDHCRGRKNLMTRFATIKNLTEQRVNATPAAPACARLKPPLPVTSPHGTSGKTANGKWQIDYDYDHDCHGT